MKCGYCGKEIAEGQALSVTVEGGGHENSFCGFECWGRAMKRATRLMKKIGVKRLSIQLEKAVKKNGGGNTGGGK